MNDQININVPGGHAAFGAISHGGNSKTIGTASITSSIVEGPYQAARASIHILTTELQRSNAERDSVLAQLALLKEKAAGQPQKTNDGRSILKLVQENFSWAYPAIKDFVKIAWPALLITIGA